MNRSDIETIIEKIASGSVVPYLGPGVLYDVRHDPSGESMPADSDSLILAMNRGRPMAPKLMYEFPRAAMNIELKRGRRFIEQFLTKLYGAEKWSRAALHDWLASLKPAYVIDINRDLQLQQSYQQVPHLLVRGIARIGGTDYRFMLHQHDGETYRGVTIEEADTSLPILFKPLGSPLPHSTYIASDADFVDYLTELMGGFGVPAFLKSQRKGKQYLFLGMRFTRDTERMVMSDIIHDAAEEAGWALIPNPTDKERRYCAKKGITIIEMDLPRFLDLAQTAAFA
ncbi:SIR2 family protein [Cohaesibacter sp. CAU 1516]|uniref:SIR2 family protein n=1 Tax=Cohaesibacter sp. CAU 1516 TaxID=2576038 RepID=UPI0010FF48FC|nr:SIR2 family protein [Cohaesibacter sp. CAU 1516]TLP44258.1 SIR2 family protein [Cohaesibacter sp. CAU 1516]